MATNLFANDSSCPNTCCRISLPDASFLISLIPATTAQVRSLISTRALILRPKIAKVGLAISICLPNDFMHGNVSVSHFSIRSAIPSGVRVFGHCPVNESIFFAALHQAGPLVFPLCIFPRIRAGLLLPVCQILCWLLVHSVAAAVNEHFGKVFLFPYLISSECPFELFQVGTLSIAES